MNPYKVLGIRPNASKEEIDTAYRNIIEGNSEEFFADSPMEFSIDEKLGQVNEAYNELVNQFKYKEIRELIETEQFISAESELNLLSDKKNAEWNYLKGFVMLKKGWVQAGVTHLKTAAEINPNNEEYKETLIILSRKLNQIKSNYAKATRQSSQGGDMCGGGSSGGGNDMCGGGNAGGAGIDPNILQSILGGMGQGGNPMGGANPMPGGGLGGAPQNPMAGMMGGGPQQNPMGGMMGGGNPLQNMLMQNLLGGGGGGMNMCGGGGGKGLC